MTVTAAAEAGEARELAALSTFTHVGYCGRRFRIWFLFFLQWLLGLWLICTIALECWDGVLALFQLSLQSYVDMVDKVGEEGQGESNGCTVLLRSCSLQAVYTHEANDDHLKEEQVWEESIPALILFLLLTGQAEVG